MKAWSERRLAFVVAAVTLGASWGCSSTSSLSNVPVAAAPPPRDDGKPAEGGQGGSEHSAALEQLKIGALEWRADKQSSIRVLLPDAPHWMRVKFWGVPSLVGFRYGKDHHAIVGAFITHVEFGPTGDPPPGACTKSFEEWANPWVEAFDVDIALDPPRALMWEGGPVKKGPHGGPRLADIDSLFAKTATVAVRDSFAVAYGAYPAWPGSCLIVGIAVPSRDDEERARQVRDRFAQEVLPKVEVIATEEPKERY